MFKNLIKKFIPKFVLDSYHKSLARISNAYYGRPSEKLIVIGVTGTNGKSTTVNLISQIFEEAGYKTVISSTVNFKIGKKEWLNDLKMTMPGRFFLQRLLKNGLEDGCEVAIIEASSEGVLQHRHIGIHFDCMIFTNLTHEHIEAHGGFENYKNAKLEYFRHLKNLPRKKIRENFIPKTIAANIDDAEASSFMNFDVDQIITFGKKDGAQFQAVDIQTSEKGISFKVSNIDFMLKLKGIFDVYNSLAAIAAASGYGIGLDVSKKALKKISNVPGRMEMIEQGQNFKVLVDYAPEPEGLKLMYESIKDWKKNKIIHVLGSTGGGRDANRRYILGQIAGMLADFVIITNEDPYNDDPQKIIDDVAQGSEFKGKVLNQNLFKILDRGQAIAYALKLAKENDLVIITGKGAEQKMAVKNGYVPWDDREVVKNELSRLQH